MASSSKTMGMWLTILGYCTQSPLLLYSLCLGLCLSLCLTLSFTLALGLALTLVSTSWATRTGP